MRVDLLTDPAGSAMVILRNLEARRIEATVQVPALRRGSAVEQFGGKALRFRKSNKGWSARVTLGAGEVRVYRA